MSDDQKALKAQIATIRDTIRRRWLHMAELPMPSLDRAHVSREIAGLNAELVDLRKRQGPMSLTFLH